MTKLLVVTGATGAQGGSVARIVSQTAGWKVRGVTRNPNGDAAKKLVGDCPNIELVAANMDDEASLVKAFEGAQAVYAVTNFWEHLFTGMSQSQSSEKEVVQAMNIARAASKTSSLEHYVWSTLPSPNKRTGGKYPCPHLESKAEVDQKIKSELPELAAKTTYLYFGFYASNFAYYPFIKPVPMGFPPKHVWLMPCAPNTVVPTTGDMTKNPGIWVRQILANPQKTRGKYLAVITDDTTTGEMLQIWSKVTGKEAVYVEITLEQYANVFGIAGEELGSQYKFNEAVPDWSADHTEAGNFVTRAEIGIQDSEVVDFEGALQDLKALL